MCQPPLPYPFLSQEFWPVVPLSHIYDSHREGSEGSGPSGHLTSWKDSEITASAETLLLIGALVSDARL